MHHALVLLRSDSSGVVIEDQLDLPELVLTDHAARVSRPWTRRLRRGKHGGRQRGDVRSAAGLPRPEDPVRRATVLVSETLRRWGSASGRRRCGTGLPRISGSWPVPNSASPRTSMGAGHFHVPVLAGLQVDRELADGAFEAREAALQHHEARARHARRGFEIHHAEGFAEIDVIFRRVDQGRGQDLWIAPTALHQACRSRSRPSGTPGAGQVRKFGQACVQGVGEAF